MQVKYEKYSKIIGRYNPISLLDAFKEKNFKNILYASLSIYLKYQIINHIMLNQVESNIPWDESSSDKNLDKNLFMFLSNVFTLCISFLIGKFLFGRRVQIIYVIISANLLLEIVFFIYRKMVDHYLQPLFYVKSIFTYILYIMVTQIGVIDITKVQLLMKNKRLTGVLLCIVIASEQAINAVFYERYIKTVSIFWTQMLYLLYCCIDN